MTDSTDRYAQPAYVLSRVRYFDGQFLKDEDFIDEQKFHIDRIQRHERLLHAPGVTAGLELTLADAGRTVKIAPGSAVDGEGRQILLPAEQSIAVDATWRGTMFVEIAYSESGTNASDGVSAFTRLTQSPTPVAVRSAPSQGAVQLGQLTMSNGVAANVTTDGRAYAGVRLPGPASSGGGGALRSLAEGGWAGLEGNLSVSGQASIGGGLRVGTADPKQQAPVITARTLDRNPADNLEGSDLVLFQGSGGTELNVITLRAPSIRLQTYDGAVSGVDDPNGSNDRLYIDPSGNVGVGTTSPDGYKLNVAGRMRAGVMNGPASDYTKAQSVLSGGGTVTWGGSGGRLKWTQRFVHFGVENGSTFASGYVDIVQPTLNIPAAHVHNNVERSANSSGVVLNGWEALWAVHEPGAAAGSVSFRITHANASGSHSVPGNWVLVAAVNGDDNTVKLGTGAVLPARGTHSKGSSVPSGTVVMWYGARESIPDGWVICDGANGTPDLRDRFIVGAGREYQPNNTGGVATVTLTEKEMPAHTHPVTLSAAGAHTHEMVFDSGDGGSLETTEMAKTADGVKSATGNFDVHTRSAGSHTHPITIATAGGSGAHENRPPYFALYFIMKL